MPPATLLGVAALFAPDRPVEVEATATEQQGTGATTLKLYLSPLSRPTGQR